jgi:hypothetical protein
MQITEVFKVQGAPTYTYVSVSNGSYERELSNSIQTAGTLCLITGPSKTGKTTLASKVCQKLRMKPVTVRCSSAMTPSDLWKDALEQVEFDRVSQKAAKKASAKEGKGEVSGGIKFLIGLSGKTSTGLTKSDGEDEIRERILSEPSPAHLIPILKHGKHLLIVEDFHYLSEAVQKTVFQQWKAFIDEEISIVVLGTTHHACDLAYANKDLVGRTSHLQMTTWTTLDLCQIAIRGFEKLNVAIEPALVRLIAEESAGLPLLTQAICLHIGHAQGIEGYSNVGRTIALSRKDCYRVFHDLAVNRFGQFEVMYTRIARGLRQGRNCQLNTYECLLSIFAQDPIVYKLDFQQIRKRLSNLPGPEEAKPTEKSVRSSLSRLKQLQEKIAVELLEWFGRDDTLYILEPSFLFYIRWRKPRSSAPKFLDVLVDLVDGFLVEKRRGVTSVTIRFPSRPGGGDMGALGE